MWGYDSNAIVVRRRFRQNGHGQDASATAVHVREVEGQGRCDEGDEDGADTEEGADEGEVVKDDGWQTRSEGVAEGWIPGHVGVDGREVNISMYRAD